jgi:hypothetical protein
MKAKVGLVQIARVLQNLNSSLLHIGCDLDFIVRHGDALPPVRSAFVNRVNELPRHQLKAFSASARSASNSAVRSSGVQGPTGLV